MRKPLIIRVLGASLVIGSVSYVHIDQAAAQSCSFSNRCSTLGAIGSGATQSATKANALANLKVQVDLQNERAKKCGYRIRYSNPVFRPFQKRSNGLHVIVNQSFCRR